MEPQEFTSQDVTQALDDARLFARTGEYEKALERHVWFFENAPKYAPSYGAVRLSFGISAWAELGEKYPPALDKLKEARDIALANYRRDPNEFFRFWEVMSINLTLEDWTSAKSLFYEGVHTD